MPVPNVHMCEHGKGIFSERERKRFNFEINSMAGLPCATESLAYRSLKGVMISLAAVCNFEAVMYYAG